MGKTLETTIFVEKLAQTANSKKRNDSVRFLAAPSILFNAADFKLSRQFLQDLTKSGGSTTSRINLFGTDIKKLETLWKQNPVVAHFDETFDSKGRIVCRTFVTVSTNWIIEIKPTLGIMGNTVFDTKRHTYQQVFQ